MGDRGQRERTAEILRGERELSTDLRDLARWISETFSTDVLNVVVDTIQNERPRISVWVRSAVQAEAFRDKDGNYDRTKQAAVAEQYARRRQTRWWSRSRPQPLVIFVAFEPDELRHVLDLVPAELEKIRVRLDSASVWRILPAGWRVVFFVHTDAEVVTLRGTAEFERWCAEFIHSVSPRDEFDLLPKLPPRFELDSKERFEREYENNTYYYLL